MPGLDHHLHELFVKEVLEIFQTKKVITNALNCSLKLDGKIPLLKTPQDLLIRHGELRLEMSGKLGLLPKNARKTTWESEANISLTQLCSLHTTYCFCGRRNRSALLEWPDSNQLFLILKNKFAETETCVSLHSNCKTLPRITENFTMAT